MNPKLKLIATSAVLLSTSFMTSCLTTYGSKPKEEKAEIVGIGAIFDPLRDKKQKQVIEQPAPSGQSGADESFSSQQEQASPAVVTEKNNGQNQTVVVQNEIPQAAAENKRGQSFPKTQKEILSQGEPPMVQPKQAAVAAAPIRQQCMATPSKQVQRAPLPVVSQKNSSQLRVIYVPKKGTKLYNGSTNGVVKTLEKGDHFLILNNTNGWIQVADRGLFVKESEVTRRPIGRPAHKVVFSRGK